MQVKSKGRCVLSKTDIAKLESASSVIEQLAFHYRETDVGKDAVEAGCFIQSLLSDDELCGR